VRGLGDSATLPRAETEPVTKRAPPPPPRRGGQGDEGPDTKRAWPVREGAPPRPSTPSFDDDTKVYDPTSAKSGRMEPFYDVEWPGAESLPALPKSGGGLRWVIAGVALLGVLGMVALWLRDRTESASAPATVPAESAEARTSEPSAVAASSESAESPEPSDEEPDEDKEDKAAERTQVSPLREATQRVVPRPPSRPPRPQPPRPPAPEKRVPPPPPAPEPAKPPDPPKPPEQPKELDDLQNPYR
jgi:hypothetical protein